MGGYPRPLDLPHSVLPLSVAIPSIKHWRDHCGDSPPLLCSNMPRSKWGPIRVVLTASFGLATHCGQKRSITFGVLTAVTALHCCVATCREANGAIRVLLTASLFRSCHSLSPSGAQLACSLRWKPSTVVYSNTPRSKWGHPRSYSVSTASFGSATRNNH